MTPFMKFKAVCIRYNVYCTFTDVNFDLFILKNIMMKAYPKHKDKWTLEDFVNGCIANPVDFMYARSLEVEHDVIPIHAVNNCFNDKSKIHYGFKYKNRWFFLTHSANSFSQKLAISDYSIKEKQQDGRTYLISYANTMPNIIGQNIGKINTEVVENYIKKYL